LGISTTGVIFLHEIPHEIGDFAYLIKRKYSLLNILATQVVTSAGAMIGGLIGIYYGQI